MRHKAQTTNQQIKFLLGLNWHKAGELKHQLTWSLGSSFSWDVLRSAEIPDVLALVRWPTLKHHCLRAGEECCVRTILSTRMSPVTGLVHSVLETWQGSVNRMECVLESEVHLFDYWLKRKRAISKYIHFFYAYYTLICLLYTNTLVFLKTELHTKF